MRANAEATSGNAHEKGLSFEPDYKLNFRNTINAEQITMPL